jgi:hypothetical protein
VLTGADSALVVVHTVVRVVLPVGMTVVKVVHMVAVHDGAVPTSRAVGMPMWLGGAMLGADSSHDRSSPFSSG